MDKFHLSADGNPRPCRALHSCPLGADTPHFASKAEARAHFEKTMAATQGEPRLNRAGPLLFSSTASEFHGFPTEESSNYLIEGAEASARYLAHALANGETPQTQRWLQLAPGGRRIEHELRVVQADEGWEATYTPQETDIDSLTWNLANVTVTQASGDLSPLGDLMIMETLRKKTEVGRQVAVQRAAAAFLPPTRREALLWHVETMRAKENIIAILQDRPVQEEDSAPGGLENRQAALVDPAAPKATKEEYHRLKGWVTDNIASLRWDKPQEVFQLAEKLAHRAQHHRQEYRRLSGATGFGSKKAKAQAEAHALMALNMETTLNTMPESLQGRLALVRKAAQQ